MRVLCAVLIGACLLSVTGLAFAAEQVQSVELAPPTANPGDSVAETSNRPITTAILGASVVSAMTLAADKEQVQSTELTPPTAQPQPVKKPVQAKEVIVKPEVKPEPEVIKEPAASPVANAVVAAENKKRLTVAEAVIPPSQRGEQPKKAVAAFWFLAPMK